MRSKIRNNYSVFSLDLIEKKRKDLLSLSPPVLLVSVLVSRWVQYKGTIRRVIKTHQHFRELTTKNKGREGQKLGNLQKRTKKQSYNLGMYKTYNNRLLQIS